MVCLEKTQQETRRIFSQDQPSVPCSWHTLTSAAGVSAGPSGGVEPTSLGSPVAGGGRAKPRASQGQGQARLCALRGPAASGRQSSGRQSSPVPAAGQWRWAVGPADHGLNQPWASQKLRKKCGLEIVELRRLVLTPFPLPPLLLPFAAFPFLVPSPPLPLRSSTHRLRQSSLTALLFFTVPLFPRSVFSPRVPS